MVAAVLGRDGMQAVLSGGGNLLFGAGGNDCKSIAAFRLVIGGAAALYVLGAREPRRFDNEQLTRDLAFFARALERAIRAWLDLPKLIPRNRTQLLWARQKSSHGAAKPRKVLNRQDSKTPRRMLRAKARGTRASLP